MSTVTQRVNSIKQPWRGYIRASQFNKQLLDDGKLLNPIENVHPSIVGMAVDYLTRFMINQDIKQSFSVSYRGAEVAEKLKKKTKKEFEKYISNIRGLDKVSIINACKVVTYDVWYRNLGQALYVQTAKDTNPDFATIENIQIMVERGITFWEKFGPIIEEGFTFEPTGYTKTVSAGDGDFLTKDTLWDFKVSESKLNRKQTLQILMYWIMGKHSGKEEFKNISKLGIYNPRLNIVYTLDVKNISPEVIKEVEKTVICYE